MTESASGTQLAAATGTAAPMPLEYRLPGHTFTGTGWMVDQIPALSADHYHDLGKLLNTPGIVTLVAQDACNEVVDLVKRIPNLDLWITADQSTSLAFLGTVCLRRPPHARIQGAPGFQLPKHSMLVKVDGEVGPGLCTEFGIAAGLPKLRYLCYNQP